MAQLNRTDYKTKIDQKITANGAEAITGTIDNDLRKDQADSFLNLLSDADLLNLRDYSVSKTYTVGEGCFYDDGGGYKVYRCINNTGGSFTGGDWEEISGGGGTSSPLTTKGDLYTYDTGNQRLPVGTDGQVLKADSAEATGLKWDSFTSADVGYTPADSDEWISPAPTTIKDALDRFSQNHDFTNVAFVDSNYTGVSEIGNINRPFTTISDATTAGASGMKIFCLSNCGGTVTVTDACIFANGFAVSIISLGASGTGLSIYNSIGLSINVFGTPVLKLIDCEVTSYTSGTGSFIGIFNNCRVTVSLTVQVFKAYSSVFDCPVSFVASGSAAIEIIGNEFFNTAFIGDRQGGIIANNQWFNKSTTNSCIRWSAGFNSSQNWSTLKVFGNTFDTWANTATTNEAIFEITNTFTTTMTMSAYGNYYRNTNFSTLTNNTITETNNTKIL